MRPAIDSRARSGVVERIKVRNFQGGFEIELVGEIVNMIDAAQPVPHNATSAAREADSIKHYASSVKVVAGTRFSLPIPDNSRAPFGQAVSPGGTLH